MSDDISEIPNNASCYTINSQSSIYIYRSNTRDTYTQIGGKWFKTATSNYTNIPTNTVCRSYSDIESLNSNAAWYPTYQIIAFGLAVFVWFFVYKLVSKFIRWKA